MKRILTLLFALVLAMSVVAQSFGQRSFGRSGGFGGGRSYSGGRSYGGGSFGRSSSGGLFGGSTRNYSRPSSPSYSGPRSSGSFGRGGSFGNSGRVNSTSANPSRGYGSGGSTYRAPVYYSGRPYYSSGGFWSGYALGTLSSPWTYYVPFHPGFYVNRPYYDDGGMYHEGGFSFTRFLLGILVIAGIVWFVGRLFRGGSGGGGGRNYRYTNFR